jgi:outer membrane protein assembly factor BamE
MIPCTKQWEIEHSLPLNPNTTILGRRQVAIKNTLTATLLCVLISGCSGLPDMGFPGVHKMDIQQGNIITNDMVELLRSGMTRSQVQYVMGTPLIVDTFNDNHWDYVYQLQLGEGGSKEQKLRIIFVNDRVSEIQR